MVTGNELVVVEGRGGGATMNPPIIKKYLELEIKTLQNAPIDAEKLERIVKAKERKRQEDISLHIEDMQNTSY
jgi:hypothetical protein